MFLNSCCRKVQKGMFCKQQLKEGEETDVLETVVEER